jgi:hypothetical protein
MSLKHPVKKVHVTQAWGVNPDLYKQFGLKGHNGIDYRAFLPNGDRCYVGGKSEVFAPHSGKVIENRLDAGYGNYVKIENDKEGSILAHFSHLSPLKVGQTVKRGDFVGFQGTTGFSSGIHLHWGYYPIPRNRANGYSGTINQLPLITTKDSMDYKQLYDEARKQRDSWWMEGSALIRSILGDVKITDNPEDNNFFTRQVDRAIDEYLKLKKELADSKKDCQNNLKTTTDQLNGQITSLTNQAQELLSDRDKLVDQLADSNETISTLQQRLLEKTTPESSPEVKMTWVMIFEIIKNKLLGE